MNGSVLEVSGLAKSVHSNAITTESANGYDGGNAVRCLFSGLDLRIGAGEFVAITGESGVGKSTLLNLIAGLDRADAGSVRINGQIVDPGDEAAVSALRRNAIGFVFQAFHILPHLTLARNIALPLILQHHDGADALVRAHAALESVGLEGRGDDFSHRLSGGELQRVAIARALIHAPPLILADEPTGNLDPETAARVLALFIDRVRETGAALLLVTHSEQVAGAADRRLHLTPDGFQ